MAEMHRYCPDTPFILVGLKKDLRVDQSAQYVQPADGARAAAAIGAKQYLETFAVTGEGVDDVFELATRLSLLLVQPRKETCCTIL